MFNGTLTSLEYGTSRFLLSLNGCRWTLALVVLFQTSSWVGKGCSVSCCRGRTVGMGSGSACLGHPPHSLPFAFTRNQCISQMTEVKEQCDERIEEVIRKRNEAPGSRDLAETNNQHQQVIWACSGLGIQEVPSALLTILSCLFGSLWYNRAKLGARMFLYAGPQAQSIVL